MMLVDAKAFPTKLLSCDGLNFGANGHSLGCKPWARMVHAMGSSDVVTRS